MLKEFQYIYGGTRLIRVTGSTESIGRIEAIAGSVKAIAVRAENVGSVGSFVFNVRKNGAALLSGSDKLTVNSGAKRAEKTDADFGEITTLKGDLLSFAMDEVGAGGILGDLIFTITIDDGVSGGADSAEEISVDNSTFVVIEGEDVQAALEEIDTELEGLADDISAKQNTLVSGTNIKTINGNSILGSGNISISGGGASALNDLSDVALSSPAAGQVLKFNGTNWANGTDNNSGGGSGSTAVDNLFSIDAKPNSDIHPLSDYFDSESDTLANSTAFQGANHRFLVDGGRAKLILPSAATEISTGRFKELPSGDCTIIIKVWNIAEKVNFANIGIALFQDAAANPNTCDYISLRAEKLATDYRLAVAYYTSYTTPNSYIGSQTSLDGEKQVPVYLKFSRTGSTWTAYYSENGRVFNQVGSSFTEGSYFVPKEFGFVAVNNTHGNTNTFDIEFLYFYDSAKAALPGGGIRQIESAVTERIICLGDSLTQGYGVYEMDSYPNKLADSLDAVAIGFDGNVFRADDGVRTKKVINKGYNGYTTQNIIDSMLRNTILRRDTDLLRDTIVVFAGTNDIGNGNTASAIYGRLTTIINDLQSAGFEVFACTIIDRNDLGGGFDTVRAALNSLITTNSAGADEVIDLFADSRLADASNATYFQTDALHLKPAGNAVIAELIEAAL